jgi:hypothetical protein
MPVFNAESENILRLFLQAFGLVNAGLQVPISKIILSAPRSLRSCRAAAGITPAGGVTIRVNPSYYDTGTDV